MLYQVDGIKGFSRCRGYYNILLSICCVYVCSAGYVELPIVLLYQGIYFVDAWVYHMLSKTRRNSVSLQRVIAYICYTLMLCVSHVEVLVLGLLVGV